MVEPHGYPPEVLSHEAVKTVEDIENLVGTCETSEPPNLPQKLSKIYAKLSVDRSAQAAKA